MKRTLESEENGTTGGEYTNNKRARGLSERWRQATSGSRNMVRYYT